MLSVRSSGGPISSSLRNGPEVSCKKEFEVDVSLFSDLHVNVIDGREFISALNETHYRTWIMAVMSGYCLYWPAEARSSQKTRLRD